MEISEQIKEQVSMRELLDKFGIYPVRGENNYLCIVHNDTRPSAGITKNGKWFHCFSCGASLSVVDMVMALKQCDMKTAIKVIDGEFGLGLLHELTHKEKLELARQSKERERLRAEKLYYEKYEHEVCQQIVREIRICEEMQRVTKALKGKVDFENRFNGFIWAEKRLGWLNWLYEVLSSLRDRKECEFDYVYAGFSKLDLLKGIEKGEIKI